MYKVILKQDLAEILSLSLRKATTHHPYFVLHHYRLVEASS